ncbi:hypothetical protein GJ744_008214 [Endocarpon pusillum]|uniref:Uncharacterized protein n=1 Tax=Endocarpon pusillum TaxID=364733 RepID=A0A8H7E5K3_9EURO|nr:hypothetical protein GJ744_008214 [Endocarpon pusillum]
MGKVSSWRYALRTPILRSGRLLTGSNMLSQKRYPLYTRTIRADVDAAKEKQVKEKVIPMIEGETSDPRAHSGDVPFTNLAPTSIRARVRNRSSVRYVMSLTSLSFLLPRK